MWPPRVLSESAGGSSSSAPTSSSHTAPHTTADLAIVFGIAAVALTLVVGELLRRLRVWRLPEAGVAILIGGATAWAMKALDGTELLQLARFDPDFFMVWLLPPIIFAAGYNMDVGALFEQIGPTLFLAFAGTLISTFTVAFLVWSAGQIGICYPLRWLTSLFFGALISATDPVTVLTVFSRLGVKPEVFAIVFGESVLNDAVAIVLCRTVLSFASPDGEGGFLQIAEASALFLFIFLGSLAVGAIAAAAAALLLKALRLRSHERQPLEASLVFAFSWASYYLAESLELSGIVAILFCGIVMASYARPNLSAGAVALTRQAFESIALVAETFIFVYLGMAALTFPTPQASSVWALAAVALGACLLARSHVFLGAALFNACGRAAASAAAPAASAPPSRGAAPGGGAIAFARKEPMPRGYAIAIWFSGLRGGVAFALAASAYAEGHFVRADDPCAANGNATDAGCIQGGEGLALLQSTLYIAFFTIFVLGALSRDVALACGLLPELRSKQLLDSYGGSSSAASPSAAPPPAAAFSRRSLLSARWQRFNHAVLVPRLTTREYYAQAQRSSAVNPVSVPMPMATLASAGVAMVPPSSWVGASSERAPAEAVAPSPRKEAASSARGGLSSQLLKEAAAREPGWDTAQVGQVSNSSSCGSSGEEK